MGIYFDNIRVDVSRIANFFNSYSLSWNYPEAQPQNEVFINNLSVDKPYKFDGASLFVINTLPANFTASNIDCANFYTNTVVTAPWLLYLFVKTWIPVDTINQYWKFDGFFLSEANSSNKDMINYFAMLFYTPHYRLIHPSMNNITLVDIFEVSNLGIFGIWGSFTEQVSLTNFYIKNTITNKVVANFRFMAQINCENFTFTNTSGMPRETMSFILNMNITMRNIHITNFETLSPISTSIISFTGLPTSVIIIEQLYAK